MKVEMIEDVGLTGLKFWGSGFGVEGLGLRVDRVQGLGFRVQG